MHLIQNDIRRLGPPYESNCVDEWEDTGMDLTKMAEEKPNYSYSVCQSHCVQLEIIATCGCYHTLLDLMLTDLNKVEFKDGPHPCDRLPYDSSKNNLLLYRHLKPYLIPLHFQTNITNVLVRSSVITIKARRNAKSVARPVWRPSTRVH